jgi:pSer/pThr/pTyr-binding forkhead associated (FHA) protein
MPGPATEAGRAALVSEIDAGESVNYQLTGLTYLGRAEDNQIRILDPGISRRHVLITATATGYTIRDLKSQNGTYLNGERIDERLLADGDRITLGEVTLVFRRGAAPASVEREPGSAA